MCVECVFVVSVCVCVFWRMEHLSVMWPNAQNFFNIFSVPCIKSYTNMLLIQICINVSSLSLSLAGVSWCLTVPIEERKQVAIADTGR